MIDAAKRSRQCYGGYRSAIMFKKSKTMSLGDAYVWRVPTPPCAFTRPRPPLESPGHVPYYASLAEAMRP